MSSRLSLSSQRRAAAVTSIVDAPSKTVSSMSAPIEIDIDMDDDDPCSDACPNTTASTTDGATRVADAAAQRTASADWMVGRKRRHAQHAERLQRCAEPNLCTSSTNAAAASVKSSAATSSSSSTARVAPSCQASSSIDLTFDSDEENVASRKTFDQKVPRPAKSASMHPFFAASRTGKQLANASSAPQSPANASSSASTLLDRPCPQCQSNVNPDESELEACALGRQCLACAMRLHQISCTGDRVDKVTDDMIRAPLSCPPAMLDPAHLCRREACGNHCLIFGSSIVGRRFVADESEDDPASVSATEHCQTVCFKRDRKNPRDPLAIRVHKLVPNCSAPSEFSSTGVSEFTSRTPGPWTVALGPSLGFLPARLAKLLSCAFTSCEHVGEDDLLPAVGTRYLIANRVSWSIAQLCGAPSSVCDLIFGQATSRRGCESTPTHAHPLWFIYISHQWNLKREFSSGTRLHCCADFVRHWAPILKLGLRPRPRPLGLMMAGREW